jgi:hypothetical protein
VIDTIRLAIKQGRELYLAYRSRHTKRSSGRRLHPYARAMIRMPRGVETLQALAATVLLGFNGDGPLEETEGSEGARRSVC